MTKDIPSQLRRYARWDNIKTPAGDALLLAAADEIERLQNLVSGIPPGPPQKSEQQNDGPRPVLSQPV